MFFFQRIFQILAYLLLVLLDLLLIIDQHLLILQDQTLQILCVASAVLR